MFGSRLYETTNGVTYVHFLGSRAPHVGILDGGPTHKGGRFVDC